MEDLQKDINSIQNENGTDSLLVCSHSKLCMNSMANNGPCTHGLKHRYQDGCHGECYCPDGFKEARCNYVIKQWD